MAKASGLGWALTLEESDAATAVDISNDITNLDISTPRGVQDATGINSSAMERVLLLADLQETINGIFNEAASASHTTLSTISSTSATRAVTNSISGRTLNAEVIGTDYALTRAASGELTWTTPLMLNSTTVPTWAGS